MQYKTIRPFVVSAFVIVAFVIAGCNRSLEQPNPPVANVMDITTITTEQVAQASSPLDPPTATPAIIATPTPFSIPYTQRDIHGEALEVTPVPAAALVTCTPDGDVQSCYDELLDMHFSYPAWMGQIQYTVLRQGSYSGYFYEYIFENYNLHMDNASYAGGRSRDFSEGRGPYYTDQSGFNGQSAESLCEAWAAVICQELSPGAIAIGILPQAEWLCGDHMMFRPIPRGILILDLPEHPLINGFAVSFSLLSPEAAAAFYEEWYSDGMRCQEETKSKLALAMDQLRQDLLAGTADPEIQLRYDTLIELAHSIQSPYIATAP